MHNYTLIVCLPSVLYTWDCTKGWERSIPLATSGLQLNYVYCWLLGKALSHDENGFYWNLIWSRLSPFTLSKNFRVSTSFLALKLIQVNIDFDNSLFGKQRNKTFVAISSSFIHSMLSYLHRCPGVINTVHYGEVTLTEKEFSQVQPGKTWQKWFLSISGSWKRGVIYFVIRI